MLNYQQEILHSVLSVIIKGKVNVSATAVFSEKKPYLHFSKDIKKRKSVVIDFKGGGDSVYSEIAPNFIVKL